MKRYFLLFAAISLIFTGSAMAMKGMDMGSGTEKESFTHSAMAGDMQVEFKVMDLASMNMKDPQGKTHHVMATFKRNGTPADGIIGKVKLVSPGGKEQIASLKDFGSGIYAANFTIDEPGKWGIICLFKDEKGKQTVKFWYPHMAM